MHLPSRQEDCVLHLKQEVIQRGIVHRLHLLKRVRMGKDRFYIYRRHFVPIPEKHWIRRHLFFALWKQSTNNPSVFCVFLETQRPKVTPSVGVEQEYFLVDREKYLKRKDLVFTGRTLFGANPPKDRNWMTIILVRSVRESQHL